MDKLIPVLAVVAVILLVVFLILQAKDKKRQVEKEVAVSAMIDSISMRRASINTEYLEKDLYRTIEQLVYSFYVLNPVFMPSDKMLPEFYMEWYNNLKREYELGIRKKLNEFRIEKAKVVKQDNSSMYAVTRLEVEMQFNVDYEYYHTTVSMRVKKQYKQRFVFLNTNYGWLLEKALPENIISKEEIPIQNLNFKVM